VKSRLTHFMPASLIESQFASMEEPTFQEALELNYQLLMVDVQQPIETICDVIVAAASSSK